MTSGSVITPHATNKIAAGQLSFENLRFSYPAGSKTSKPFALNLNFSVSTPIKLAILGPNGCGKTTLLSLLGGHLVPSAGSISWDSLNLSDLRPGSRPTCTVFQDHALFPNHTVRENIRFALRHSKSLTRQAADGVATYWIKRLHLDAVEDKLPAVLSRGLQQRVAIARSLAMKPRMLLLDEPTAALDVDEKRNLVILLNELFSQKAFEALILVTHDLDFAFSVAEQVVVIRDGNLCSLAERDAMQQKPSTLWLARFLQSMNVIEGVVHPSGTFVFDTESLDLSDLLPDGKPAIARAAALVFSPTAITLVEAGHRGRNNLTAQVKASLFHGAYRELSLAVGSADLRSFVREFDSIHGVGSEVLVEVDLRFARVLPIL